MLLFIKIIIVSVIYAAYFYFNDNKFKQIQEFVDSNQNLNITTFLGIINPIYKLKQALVSIVKKQMENGFLHIIKSVLISESSQLNNIQLKTK